MEDRCLHAPSPWETVVSTSRQCFARPRWRTSFFKAPLVSHPCECASLGQERRRPLEEANCHVRLQSFFFAVLRGGQSGARLPPLLQCVHRKLQKHCRRFEADNFNESSDYRSFFCLRQLFFLVASSLSPILRHRDISVYLFFSCGVNFQRFHYRLPVTSF